VKTKRVLGAWVNRLATVLCSVAVGVSAGCAGELTDDVSLDEGQRGLAPATNILARVAITTLPGASANAGQAGTFVARGFRVDGGAAPTLSNSLLSAVPGAPAKPLFVGQARGFDAVIVGIRGQSGAFEVPAGGNALVALDLVPSLRAPMREVTVLVATRSGRRVSSPASFRLLIDEHVFVAAGDLENHDSDGSNIADLFAPFLEGSQGFPPVAEQVLEGEDNNDILVDGVKGPAGPLASGHREVVWDGVPQALRNRPDFSPLFFDRQNSGSSGVRGGIIFQDVNGSGQEVNDALAGKVAPADQPLPAEGEEPLGGDFSNINGRFAGGSLLSFTQSAQFVTLGTVITDITFNIAGTRNKAVVNGLGIVFSSVDREGASSVEYFDERGRSVAKIKAPVQSKGPFPLPGPLAADKFPYSFVGFVDPNVRIARVRVTAGEIPLDRAADDLPRGNRDVVAFDDVYYGEPRP